MVARCDRYLTREGSPPTPLQRVVADARSKHIDGVAFFCRPCKARLKPGPKPSIVDAKIARSKQKRPSSRRRGRPRSDATMASPSPQSQPASAPSAPSRPTITHPEKVVGLLEFGESSDEENTWEPVLDLADLAPEFGTRGVRNQYAPEPQRAFRVGRPSSSKAPEGTDRRVRWESGVAHGNVDAGSMAGPISDAWLGDVVAGNACRAPGCPGFTSAEVKVQMGPASARRISAKCNVPACSQQVVHECGGALNAPPPSKASGLDASFFASGLEAAATWQSILSQSDATTLRSSQAAAGVDSKLQTPPAATKMLMERGACGLTCESASLFLLCVPLAFLFNI